MNKALAVITALIIIVLSGCNKYTTNTEQKTVPDAYQPKFKLESLRFFTAGEKGAEKELRVYNTSFRIGGVDRIWYELIVSPMTDKESRTSYREVWYDGENRIISSVIKQMTVRPEKYLEYTAGIKTDWVKGYYVLKLFQDSMEVANREFKITD
ncbi:MAG TPA: hypothetical protein PLK90_10175 [Clostridiales bacterium]|nr:hypothetical protein [Clostridiales bacterium]HQP70753.1 hypothetical protein [Clostridiales bacterium]